MGDEADPPPLEEDLRPFFDEGCGAGGADAREISLKTPPKVWARVRT